MGSNSYKYKKSEISDDIAPEMFRRPSGNNSDAGEEAPDVEGLSFREAVYAAVRRIPRGKVATYGQIAALAGSPGAARAAGNALHCNPDGDATPCYRVVNAQGKLSGAFAFGGIDEQKRRLEADGIEVINMRVDLAEYKWRPLNRSECIGAGKDRTFSSQ